MAIPFVDLKAQYRNIAPDVQRRINQVLEHGQYILGPEVFELESKLASYVGVKHCISTSSGTDSLLMALMALNVGPGDEVITTPFSFMATAEVIALLGATPVFVDIDATTYNIDATKIRSVVSENTKVILPVSLFGQCADMDEINDIAREYELAVIEDGAQSFGATYKGNKSCGLSTLGATSFFPTKPLGCYGDGGALFTNDDDLNRILREIRVHGQESRYRQSRLGINGRLDTIQAAILLAKLDIFDSDIKKRALAASRYSDLLKAEIASVEPPDILTSNVSVYAQYTIRIKNREKVIQRLSSMGIPSAVHYPGLLPAQPVFKHFVAQGDSFPIAENAAQTVLSLPMHPEIELVEQEEVVAGLKNALDN
ncbi:MAG: DegT/DnrJ/EryC1/StrS family aminotransferase [Pseudomonadales bacterium]